MMVTHSGLKSLVSRTGRMISLLMPIMMTVIMLPMVTMIMTMTMVTMKTLRPQKLGEQDGQDYFFASREKMQV